MAATALRLKGDTTLVLNGTNSVTSNYSGIDHTHGIYCEGKLTIQGTGTLTATGGTATGSIVHEAGSDQIPESRGVYSINGITVSGGSITGTGGTAEEDGLGSYGVCAEGVDNIIFVDGGSITGISSRVVSEEGSLYCRGIVADKVEVNSGRLVGESVEEVQYIKNQVSFRPTIIGA